MIGYGEAYAIAYRIAINKAIAIQEQEQELEQEQEEETTAPAPQAPLDPPPENEPKAKPKLCEEHQGRIFSEAELSKIKRPQMPRRKPPTQLETAQAESILEHYRAVVKSAHTSRKPAIRNIVSTLRGGNSGVSVDPEDLKRAATAYGVHCDAKGTEASYRTKDANFYGRDDPWEDWRAAGRIVEKQTRRQTPEEIKANSDRIVEQFKSWSKGEAKSND